MKIDRNKLKIIVRYIYVKEIVGKCLFESLASFPEIQKECDVLSDLAVSFEESVLTDGADYEKLKNDLSFQILSVHNICRNHSKYRQSLIFFDEFGNFIDLI